MGGKARAGRDGAAGLGLVFRLALAAPLGGHARQVTVEFLRKRTLGGSSGRIVHGAAESVRRAHEIPMSGGNHNSGSAHGPGDPISPLFESRDPNDLVHLTGTPGGGRAAFEVAVCLPRTRRLIRHPSAKIRRIRGAMISAIPGRVVHHGILGTLGKEEGDDSDSVRRRDFEGLELFLFSVCSVYSVVGRLAFPG